MRHTMRFAALAFGLSILLCATAAHAQRQQTGVAAFVPTVSRGQAYVDDVWYVLERTIPAPASRTDWVAVGRSDAQRDGWRITRAPTSFALATALADVHRLDERFRTVCDKSYNVYRNPVTRGLSVSRDAVGGQLLESTGLCCENAFEIAFPTPPGTAPATGDCRTLPLLSVPGALLRLTPAGWRAVGGMPIPIPTVPPTVIPAASLPGPTGGGSCRTVQKTNQPESRDASGRIRVEAATIHVMNCPSRGQIYVYQYLNRSGFRAIRPPDWGRAIGGRDFPTFEQAQQAAAAGEAPVISQPVQDKDSIFWGTWNGVGNAKGITMTLNRDYTMTFNDTRPAYQKSGKGKWVLLRPGFIDTDIGYGFWYLNDGRLRDPWGNFYVK